MTDDFRLNEVIEKEQVATIIIKASDAELVVTSISECGWVAADAFIDIEEQVSCSMGEEDQYYH